MKLNEIKSEIKFYEDCLEKVSSELKRLVKKVPEGGRLRVARHGKGYQYFLRSQGFETNGRYIRRGERNIAIILARIEYDENLIRMIKDKLALLKEMEYLWVDNPFEDAASQMIEGKRLLVEVPYVSDQTYIDNWLTQEYKSLGFKEDYPEFYARNNLRVRSKSEVIIADMLDEVGIPFLYEKPVKLGSGVVHPDFTLLDIGNRKEIYWEHFGMMDDVEYRNNAFFKIRNYESNGLFQHDSFIYTFETNVFPLNIKEIRKMIKMLKVKIGYCNI